MERIFALDIGTRSVTGMIIEKNHDNFQVIDHYNIEHHKRSMRDGQIHDVLAVADIIKNVKETLEKRTDMTLHKVSVAAAGRALKTTESSASVNLLEVPIQSSEDVKHLELTAVQAAQEKLATEQATDSYSNYYCVGYSVLHYKLDGEIIGSPIDQKGNEASVEIIATFLPKIVVESLLASVSRAGLEMEAMTLEPIAALHVLVPESMRRLNVVLVDIGAGTSDIAIADKGTVAAYGMVPVAGDEITEAISDLYLLDFPQAEVFKREIVNNGEAETEDILGFPTTVTLNELVTELDKTIDKLAEKIAGEMMRLNNKQPRAVMLIGGGSLTPHIQEKIAEKLDLPENRVAIRGVDAIKQVENIDKLPSGPEFITPVGIGITAQERPVQYIELTVNKQTMKLFNWNELNIGSCLVQAGIEINRMYGKPGAAMMITVNGKEMTIPGGFGKAPLIHLNGKEATIEDPVQAGDVIDIEPGHDGEQAQLTLQELIGTSHDATVYFQGVKHNIGRIFTVNGKEKKDTYEIQDGDELTWFQIDKLIDFLKVHRIEQNLQPFSVLVNHKKVTFPHLKESIYVNGQETNPNIRLQDGDTIEMKPVKKPTVIELYEHVESEVIQQITVTFNGEQVTLKKPLKITKNGETLDDATVINRNDKLEILAQTNEPFIFQDVFAYVELDLSQATGQFSVLRNGEKASFDEIIIGGDQLEIKWD